MLNGWKAMNRIKEKISELYKETKRNPELIFKNPFNLLLIPVFFVILIKNRWKTQTEFIFLTETKIDGHPLLNREIKPFYQIKKFFDYQLANRIIEQRVKEEKGAVFNIEDIKKRFERGDYMMVLFVNNLPASYLFISEKIAYFQQVNFKEVLDNDCFAIYDVYTFIDFRGKGLYEDLISVVLNQMKKHDRFWLWVMQHNQISVKVHHRLQINRVICIYEENFRFGFRVLKKKNTNFLLSDLIS